MLSYPARSLHIIYSSFEIENERDLSSREMFELSPKYFPSSVALVVEVEEKRVSVIGIYGFRRTIKRSGFHLHSERGGVIKSGDFFRSQNGERQDFHLCSKASFAENRYVLGKPNFSGWVKIEYINQTLRGEKR